MFRREIDVRLARPASRRSSSDTEPRTAASPETITKYMVVAEEGLKYVAIVVGAGYILKKVVDTSSEIALIAARNHI